MTGADYVDVDGIRTRYFGKGSGPGVVLFHGSHIGRHDGAEDWNLNFDGPVKRFHAHALEKIGQGFTDNSKRSQNYTMAAVALHTWGFRRALGP